MRVINISIISLRVTEEEREILIAASKMYDSGISSMIKKIVFEKLEDNYDLKIIDQYVEEKKQELTLELYAEFSSEMGSDWCMIDCWRRIHFKN